MPKILEPLESLPLFKKLPFNSKEKRILGFATLLSTSIFAFCTITYILIHIATAPHNTEEPNKAIATKETKATTPKEYDKLEQEALIIAAEAYINHGNPTKAGEFMEKLSSINPKSNRQRRITADILVHQGRKNEALPYLEQLRQEEPNNLQTAKLYIQSLPIETLLKLPLDSLVKPLHKSPDILYTTAQAIKNTTPEESALLFIEALNKNPHHHQSMFALGMLYFESSGIKDISKAKTYLTRATNEAPDSASYWESLGVIELAIYEDKTLTEKADSKECETAFTKAISLKPNSAKLHYYLAELYSYDESKYFLAENSYTKSLKINPSFGDASFKLGMLYSKNKKHSGATKMFYDALKHSDDNVRILHQLAVTYEKSGNTKKSQDIYKQIVTINPKDNIALYKLQIIK